MCVVVEGNLRSSGRVAFLLGGVGEEIEADDEGDEEVLGLQREAVLIDHGHEVARDEVLLIGRQAGAEGEVVLERGQRTDDAGADLGVDGPRDGGEVHHGRPDAASGEKAAGDDEQDEQQVHHHGQLGEDAVHG